MPACASGLTAPTGEQLRQLVETPDRTLLKTAAGVAQRRVCVAADHARPGAVWARLWLAGRRSARFGVLSAPWLEMVSQHKEFLHHLRLYT